jgi:hypothetical protein
VESNSPHIKIRGSKRKRKRRTVLSNGRPRPPQLLARVVMVGLENDCVAFHNRDPPSTVQSNRRSQYRYSTGCVTRMMMVVVMLKEQEEETKRRNKLSMKKKKEILNCLALVAFLMMMMRMRMTLTLNE